MEFFAKIAAIFAKKLYLKCLIDWVLNTPLVTLNIFTECILLATRFRQWLSLCQKCPNSKFLRIFPYLVWSVFSRIQSGPYFLVFRLNMDLDIGKYGPEKTQNSDPFHVAFSSLEVDWCKFKFNLTRHKFLYLKLFSTIKENHLCNHVSLPCFTWDPTFGVCGIVNPNFPLIYKFSRCLEFFTELFVPMQPFLFSYISKFVSDLIVCFKGLF